MITIHGIIYDIKIQNNTEEMNDAPNLQKHYRENGIVSTLYVQKPKGARTWMVHQFINGEFGRLINIGRI